MAFGYDTTVGWLPVTYEQMLKDLRTKYESETFANIDTASGPPADMLRTLALPLTRIWRDAEGAYNAGFIDFAPGSNGVAGGSALELLLSPRIGPKIGAAASTVVLTRAAAVGPDIAVPAGSAVRLASDTETWTLDAPVLIPGGGTIDGDFTFAATGPKTALAGSTWVIATPVSGWTGVTQAAAADPGRDAETDAEYRDRWRRSIDDETVTELRQLDGVTFVAIIEHPSGIPDPVYGLTHWVEYLIVGGNNEAIGGIINRTRAKGGRSAGNTTVVIANPDYVGGTVQEQFSRPVDVQTWVIVTITPGEGYPTDGSTAATEARKTAIRQSVIAYFGSLLPGNDTSGFAIASYINARSGISGISNIVVNVDTIDPPVNTGTLVVAERERLTILLADIDVFGA